MSRVARGDAQAYRALVERHAGRCMALARRLGAGAADAEDLVQEGFLRVWRHAPRWRSEGARFTTWLYRVMVNLHRDRLRRAPPASGEGDAGLATLADPAPGPAAALRREALARAVQTALSELPERQREVIALCHYQGLTNAEAARVLSVGVGAVESLLVRARRTLRVRLAPWLGGEEGEDDE